MKDQLDDIMNPDGCPKCGSQNVSAVKYTWWGGVVGPKLLHHTKCADCKYVYNSKTRESNTRAIVIYSVVIFIVVFGITFMLKSR